MDQIHRETADEYIHRNWPAIQEDLVRMLKLEKQPMSFRTAVKPYLEAVALHKRFIPETARRLADPVFTKGLYIHEYTLGQFVEKREQLLQEILQGLDDESKAALALIYMRNDRLESPITLQPSEEQALARLRSDIGGGVAALEVLNGSLVQLLHDEDQAFWRYKHPTIGDAYASLLVQSPELQRLPPADGNRTVRRASNLRYFDRHPDLLDKVAKPGLLLHAVPEVDLAVRLHELGLLPDGHRKKFIATVSNYALAGEDLYALEDLGIRSEISARPAIKRVVG